MGRTLQAAEARTLCGSEDPAFLARHPERGKRGARTPMLTPSSSAAKILHFTPQFEPWREHWHRRILADSHVGHRAARVAGFLVWHLNRDTRGCFPSYATIAKGVGIDRRNAKRDVKTLIDLGYLKRQQRGRTSNYYFPSGVVVNHQVGAFQPPGGGSFSPPGGADLAPLTSDLTSDLTLLRESLFFEERKARSLPREEVKPRKLTEPELASLERLAALPKRGRP